MEPDFVREQVKNIWRVVASNAKLISERKLSVLEGAFVDTAFVVNQVCSLHDAVSDSVNMHAAHGRDRQFVIMKPEFLNQQGRALQAVIEDSARLQDQSRTAFPGLRSLSDGFVLELVENLRDVVRDNATIALERQLQPNALSMCRPDSVFRLVASFQCALVGYFQQARSAAALQEHRLAAERACADSEARADAMSAEKAAAEAKIAELQASLAALQSEVDQLKADAKEAEDATQVRIFKLEEELASISSARLSCDPMSSKLEAELTSLREEHKNIIKTCEEQRDAAALAVRQVLVVVNEKQQLQTERDRLATEISDLHQAHQAFSLARAREHEKMIEETARLQGSLREHEAAANSKCEENKMLKAALDSVKADLHATNNQLTATVIQCDSWKAMLDDVTSRHATELDAVRQAAARRQEIADNLLSGAVKKIEELENQLRRKNEQISALPEIAARIAQQAAAVPIPKAPASPPPSSRKRTSAGAQRPVTAASSSSGGVWAGDLSTHGSPMPADRVKELAAFPEVAVGFGSGQSTPVVFTRQSLSNILGGSIQGLIVRCTQSATTLARKHEIQEYLCPNMDHNAWSPAGPGKHGYMQVGLGRDRKFFNEGDYRHVFVGAGKHFLYCGWYHVIRVDPLSKEEWATLPPKVQSTYSETTVNKEKNKDLKSAQQVLSMYNSGELRAPCVRLQCVKFDAAFYQELVRANDQFFEHKPRPMPPSSAGGSSAKRRRIAEVEEKTKDEGSEDQVSLALAVGLARSAASAPSAASASSSMSLPDKRHVGQHPKRRDDCLTISPSIC